MDLHKLHAYTIDRVQAQRIFILTDGINRFDQTKRTYLVTDISGNKNRSTTVQPNYKIISEPTGNNLTYYSLLILIL